jgi:hypothetical protein
MRVIGETEHGVAVVESVCDGPTLGEGETLQLWRSLDDDATVRAVAICLRHTEVFSVRPAVIPMRKPVVVGLDCLARARTSRSSAERIA